ncbi:MAG: DUF2752 domain-containing protein [Mycobacteriales bacterium]
MSNLRAASLSPAPVVPPAELAAQVSQEVVVSKFEERVTRLWLHPTWLAPLAIFGCFASAATWVLVNDGPTDAKPDPVFGRCLFRTLTGLDCPGCGGTRMMWHLLHGDVLQAARYHLIALLAVPVVIYAYVAMVVNRTGRFRLPTLNLPVGVLIGYFVMWVVFAVGRNLPWEPLSFFHV